MAVRGDEAGDHEVAVGVDDFVGEEAGGWFSGCDGEDGAVGRDGEIAVDRLALIGGHSHNTGVADDEFGIRGKGGTTEDGENDEYPANEDRKMTGHGCV
jgi:hypothetical protein